MIYTSTDNYELRLGKMQDEIATMDSDSIDSIVTDPPYELGFMGKSWDSSGVAFQKETWEHCYRILKPGGYLLAFGGSRTYHRIACAIEDAGFEIRDTIMWLYGSGFPKSMNIGKSIEGKLTIGSGNVKDFKKLDGDKVRVTCGFNKTSKENGYRDKEYEMTKTDVQFHTECGQKYSGWGTALKPAYEPIIVARKPFKGSCVDNVLEYGVGGINIDECRVPLENNYEYKTTSRVGRSGADVFSEDNCGFNNENNTVASANPNGRFPSNVILTYDDTDFEEVCGDFPNTSSSGGKMSMPDLRDVGKKSKESIGIDKLSFGQVSNADRKYSDYIAPSDSGSASRYFYCAKASKKDRDDGLDALEKGKNTHPTVKPTTLMQYLVRLVTPKGGTVLDPFMGSGSTGKATMIENVERNADYKFIGIEMTEEYLPICKARIDFGCGYVVEDDIHNSVDVGGNHKNVKVSLW